MVCYLQLVTFVLKPRWHQLKEQKRNRKKGEEASKHEILTGSAARTLLKKLEKILKKEAKKMDTQKTIVNIAKIITKYCLKDQQPVGEI